MEFGHIHHGFHGTNPDGINHYHICSVLTILSKNKFYTVTESIISHHSKINAKAHLAMTSDVQGFVNPPRVRGKGQKGKGQGKDFLTLNKPLTLVKGQGFSGGFSGVLFL